MGGPLYRSSPIYVFRMWGISWDFAKALKMCCIFMLRLCFVRASVQWGSPRRQTAFDNYSGFCLCTFLPKFWHQLQPQKELFHDMLWPQLQTNHDVVQLHPLKIFILGCGTNMCLKRDYLEFVFERSEHTQNGAGQNGSTHHRFLHTCAWMHPNGSLLLSIEPSLRALLRALLRGWSPPGNPPRPLKTIYLNYFGSSLGVSGR